METKTVYVVKLVLVDKESVVLTEEKGLGVYLTYEDAKKQFDKVVSDLKELYEDDLNGYVFHVDDGRGLNDFYAYHEGYQFCDFVGLYECEIGKWNFE